jgi:hypothetical protein
MMNHPCRNDQIELRGQALTKVLTFEEDIGCAVSLGKGLGNSDRALADIDADKVRLREGFRSSDDTVPATATSIKYLATIEIASREKECEVIR